MAVLLLSFNVSTCFYLRGLIKAFHRNENDLPKWAKASRRLISRLEGSNKQLFLEELFEDTQEIPSEKDFTHLTQTQ